MQENEKQFVKFDYLLSSPKQEYSDFQYVPNDRCIVIGFFYFWETIIITASVAFQFGSFVRFRHYFLYELSKRKIVVVVGETSASIQPWVMSLLKL